MGNRKKGVTRARCLGPSGRIKNDSETLSSGSRSHTGAVATNEVTKEVGVRWMGEIS